MLGVVWLLFGIVGVFVFAIICGAIGATIDKGARKRSDRLAEEYGTDDVNEQYARRAMKFSQRIAREYDVPLWVVAKELYRRTHPNAYSLVRGDSEKFYLSVVEYTAFWGGKYELWYTLPDWASAPSVEEALVDFAKETGSDLLEMPHILEKYQVLVDEHGRSEGIHLITRDIRERLDSRRGY